MRIAREWLRDEAPDPFRNANLKDALTRHGFKINHQAIGGMLTRMAERGELTRLGHGTYRVNADHAAFSQSE